ncbi:FAD-binding molybdopterin dehydrogenase [Actinoalloteichus sp. AHMU CJ021]|uniref:CO or xanthine dehydrogenase, FAD-binding subunit n=1 Tax=Actinoalloteichus caeruleus DSM 43889 TaxID=1120930 RepID=A0ABT1JDU3_ACTCY|nr:FAD binding domain-containing protein [Actinoalloteichus caeruleus]AUS80442.1 FAD-binding molybdopterin dehydrogenase [Actinoalloteichus sp. AHMU CJ021]MCP2330301.1 CO or xanthine dehydrogenase, FAD-binding subunit [Actinoalloteichus caeruleus DSM 43889]
MDLNTVTEVRDARQRGEWRPGDAWLAGGTYLFSEPQPHLRRLVDLARMDWPPVAILADGSWEIAATCTIAELSAFAATTGPATSGLVERCCRAFLASVKIWNTATVGGNLCLALPAGPMISLTAALGAVCRLIATDGTRRALPVTDLITGPARTALTEGELLRSVTIPARALSARTAFRRASQHQHGRSSALLVGTLDGRRFSLTVTASTPRPVVLEFAAPPTAEALSTAIDGAVGGNWLDDVHGIPAWRRHLTLRLADEVLAELGAAP